MEYLSKLGERLSSLPAKEREAALKYYDDLFNDAGFINEQAVISSLGSPQSLAHTILNDRNGIAYELNKTKKEVKAVKNKMTARQSYIAAVIIIITFPIWGSLLLIFLLALLSMLVAAALILSAFAILGAALFCMGVAYINRSFSITLALLGTGIAMTSLSLLLFSPVMNLVIRLMRFILKKSIKLLNNILGKKEADN